MSDFRYDVQSSLGFLSITVNRLLNAFLRRNLAAAGIDLTGEQWGVLVQIWLRQGMTQEELAPILCVDKSSLSRVLRLMEAKGLVERRKSGRDARRKLLYSTPGADALRDRALVNALESQRRALEGISEADVAVTLSVLGKVKENIKGDKP